MDNYVRNMKLFKDNINYVRGLIPELSRVNFDRNLCNLTIFVDYIRSGFGAQYSYKFNRIELIEKDIKESKKKYNKDFPNYFNYVIDHELIHVASSRNDRNKNILLSGFSKIYLNKDENHKSQRHYYLDEGFINYLLSKDYKFNEIYTLQNYFAGQLSEIVGLDLMKDAFFNNKGITPIKDKLKSIDVSEENINSFFNDFEEFEHDYFTGDITSSLPHVQNMLLDFYSKKIKSLSSKEEVLELKSNFVTMVKNTMNFGIYYVNYLHPKDSVNSIEKQKGIKAKVKTI